MSEQPALRVVRGDLDENELAALVLALRTRRRTTVASAVPLSSRWADRRALVRAPVHPGPGAWRAAVGR
ncbi:MAG: acyl-CoA carboxylase subunit epsilon [Frankia sp.]|nr:acyl-CoA carboxylase subunit epsilon [Frankia sp.]